LIRISREKMRRSTRKFPTKMRQKNPRMMSSQKPGKPFSKPLKNSKII
jgi:hypothetical protein